MLSALSRLDGLCATTVLALSVSVHLLASHALLTSSAGCHLLQVVVSRVQGLPSNPESKTLSVSFRWWWWATSRSGRGPRSQPASCCRLPCHCGGSQTSSPFGTPSWRPRLCWGGTRTKLCSPSAAPPASPTPCRTSR